MKALRGFILRQMCRVSDEHSQSQHPLQGQHLGRYAAPTAFPQPLGRYTETTASWPRCVVPDRWASSGHNPCCMARPLGKRGSASCGHMGSAPHLPSARPRTHATRGAPNATFYIYLANDKLVLKLAEGRPVGQSLALSLEACSAE